ncbi:MAG: hypothetical protein K0S27_796 [Gammaproteobacteria bacterium]|jgi:type IV secretory pathway VirB10-like protein|nr:hypothetical protein [Gammaproteobacteria bacterium]
MAFKFPGLKIFSPTDSKSRVVILLVSFVGIAAVIYISMHLLSGGGATPGPSKVAGAPSGLQSIPGNKQLSPEYYRTLAQANEQAVRQAQISGGSAVPTLINTPAPQETPSQNCTILCQSEDKTNVADDINAFVKTGRLSQKEGDRLIDFANKNISISEYAAELDDLVSRGKLLPEQARLLLNKYKKQHANALLSSSAIVMDNLIKSGRLPLSVANDLLELQKRKATPAEYAAYLAKLVKEGKLSPAAAAQLLAQYTQQYAQEASKDGGLAIKQMAKEGQITPDIAKVLEDMQSKNVPVDQYEAMLTKSISEGKITPLVAAKLLALYKAQRTNIGASGLLGTMLAKGGTASDEANRLLNMQANNASLSDYTDELKRAVAAGLITPEEAASLLQQYQAMLAAPVGVGVTPGVQTVIPGAEDFAKLQRNVEIKGPVATAEPIAPEQFVQAVAQKQVQSTEDRQRQVQQLQAAMSTQAQNLLVAWHAPSMKHESGEAVAKKDSSNTVIGKPLTTGIGINAGASEKAPLKPSLIKAGTIAYAVLDTAVDSDYPDTPVMATIVQGPLKGAKLIGKLALAQGQDKVSLNFTQMDKTEWPTTRTVSAFAVDPDTAHTVLASEVDYHYLKRYGAIMATSFLSGYSSAITQAGTSTTGIFGTSATHNALSPTNKIAVGLGQIGTNLNNAVQPYINTPVTVKVHSGVGLGILFVADVTE